MAKDIHAKPFDEGTMIKLELFRLYLREWLPVFVKYKDKQIELYDFFAGEGCDPDGNPGSPLILLDELRPYCANFIMNPTDVQVHFNDASSNKVSILQTNAQNKLENCSVDNKYGFCKNQTCPFKIHFHNKNFENLFTENYPGFFRTQNIPRFLFIDQYGIKQVTQDVFKKLTSLKRTDFMFFISSNHIMRFKEQPEFRAYIDSGKLDFSESKPAECHRVIFNYYRSLLNGKSYYLGQFSIKKNSNIYGVIFGSSHPLGLKKFLDAAWKIDPHTGETNYDIDGDPIRKGQLTFDLFETGTQDKVKKLVAFEQDLIDFLKTPQSNKRIYTFAIEKGVSIHKTIEILKSLENSNRLIFSGNERRRGAFYLDYDHEKNIYIQSK